MAALKELFSGLDPESILSKLIPQLDTLMGWIVLAARLCVMIIPLLLLGFGLLFLLTPPKEANYKVGYRFWWSMASLDAWRYTQRLAGLIWSGLGLALTVIMSIVCAFFVDMAAPDMATAAFVCVIIDLVLAAAACIFIDVMVVKTFDRDGYRRSDYEE